MSARNLPVVPCQENKEAAKGAATPSEEGDPLLLKKLMKSLRNKESSESGSSNGGNNSDNSALVSLGNTSFGFNFDSEEGMSNNSKEGQNDSNEDSDPGQSDAKPPAATSASLSTTATERKVARPKYVSESDTLKSSISSLTNSSKSDHGTSAEHNEAAANAVASLESVASSYPKLKQTPMKRKSTDLDGASSGGYNTDDDEKNPQKKNSSSAKDPKSQKKKRVNDRRREERNQREKERSFRISKQITELRNLLSSGGVVVPKGTKSSVLTEAANYIRMLQQHQYRSEIDRAQSVQQMQLIGSGANGPQAAAAVRHVAAKNGVWSLGNFGGVPPKSAMTFYQPAVVTSADQSPQSGQQTQLQDSNIFNQNKIDPSEYRFIFDSCGAGMAIASMGGAFIDCNRLFCRLSNYTKQEICSLTIFNLTARQDLQQAFDQISRLISPPMDESKDQAECPKPIIIRGSMKNRNDLGMSVALVKDYDGIVAKCFVVTLVKNPTSPFDSSKPVPVSFDAIQSTTTSAEATSPKDADINTAPAFTSG